MKFTCIIAVIESSPDPPDAKHTPVTRSLLERAGLRYAGKRFFNPNPSAAHDTIDVRR